MSSPFRTVTDDFWVSPQIDVADVAAAAAGGVRLIINNRPEGEGPGQTPGSEIAAAAAASEMSYLAIPVRGRPTPEQVQAMHEAVSGSGGPVLAYCLSGTRSIIAWAIGQSMAGARTPADLVALGRGAGYDLSPLFGR